MQIRKGLGSKGRGAFYFGESVKIYRWHLGYVYNNDGKLINHRPLLKVIINPFLRPFKKCIASNINYSDMTVKYVFIDCDYVPFFKGIS